MMMMITHSMFELLQPGMRDHQVKTVVWQEPQCRYWRPNAVAGESESQTRAWSPPTSIQGQDRADSDTSWRKVWKSLALVQAASEDAAAAVSRGRIDGRRGSVALLHREQTAVG